MNIQVTHFQGFGPEKVTNPQVVVVDNVDEIARVDFVDHFSKIDGFIRFVVFHFPKGFYLGAQLDSGYKPVAILRTDDHRIIQSKFPEWEFKCKNPLSLWFLRKERLRNKGNHP